MATDPTFGTNSPQVDKPSPVDDVVSRAQANLAEIEAAAEELRENNTDSDVGEKIEGKVPSRFAKSPGENNPVDDQLVDQTKKQIRKLVQEIAELSKSDCEVEEFYEGFLTRTATALASVGAAIWVKETPSAPLQLHYQINLRNTGLADNPTAQARHGKLLEKTIEANEPTLIAPNSGSAESEGAGNPTEFLLVIGPLIVDQQPIGLVEIFQRPGAGPTTQRGYLRFLNQMCDIASDYLRNQRLRTFSDQQAMWQQLEQFIRLAHRSLDTDETVYTISNEGRRLIDCDRVSVAIAQGSRCRIRSVSGLDSIERRAEQIKKLNLLSSKVLKTGEPLWYTGDDSDLPPQIENRLHEYVDLSHAKLLGILPLHENDVEEEQETLNAKAKRKTKKRPLGVLVVEQLKDSRMTPALQKRVDVVVEHSEIALTNSVDHNSVFLMPLWKRLGKVTSSFRAGGMMKTMAALGLVGLLGAVLCLFPYPFALGAKGKLKPEIQHEVFAQIDGVLGEIRISDNDDALVEKGQELAVMTNNDLMLEIETLKGELMRTIEQISALQRSQVQDMEPIDAIMLDGDFAKARATAASLKRKIKLREDKAALLTIRSPAQGRVVNWQVRQNLLRRPVSKGQNLMTIVDPNTQWEIELEMPERRVAHLMEAIKASDEGPKVTFSLVSHPGKEFTGRVCDVDQKMEVHSDDGNSTLVRVTFDNADIDSELLRSGTRVTAKVQCGERSVGYVVFHELIETVQSSFMLWF